MSFRENFMSHPSLHLSSQQIKKNIQALQAWMVQKHLDYFYLSGFDTYMSEYVPREDTHRYYVTGFTGSTGEVLVPAQGHVVLYVDGRYYEQAEREVDETQVRIRRSDLSVKEAFFDDLRDFKNVRLKLGIEADRTPFAWNPLLSARAKVEKFHSDELQPLLHYLPFKLHNSDLKSLDTLLPSETPACRIAKIIRGPHHGIFISALDQIAWVSNARGYQMPNGSPFFGKALITSSKVFIFHPLTCDVPSELAQHPQLQWLCWEKDGLAAACASVSKSLNLEHVDFDPDRITIEDYSLLENIFGATCLHATAGGLVHQMSRKSPAELEALRSSFDLADRAIFESLKEMRMRMGNGEKLSEEDLQKTCERHYREQGAICQSFATIASCGSNTSMIHYNKSSAENKIEEGQWMMLDSGGYFPWGFATDTTRTMMAHPKAKPSKRQRNIYTLVLKSYIMAHRAVVKEGTIGAVIDALARYSLHLQGLNYEHGTGHGLGIMVHEGGINFRPNSTQRLFPGQVISLEPGLYFSGELGCRFENILEVMAHPRYSGYVCFRSLVYIGVDPALVDESLLTSEELDWLIDYEESCHKRGRSFGWHPNNAHSRDSIGIGDPNR